ncbi:DUF1566 domain-containing protein [Legionella tunisiensis]|uniref:DUF1566 domain-containing protein n=1 Tax=Legionella tunisiensis TaxID=1034944 RepID=UPI0002E51F07|nr:DUF1566 domain-containing protein [Legionella tunisiensis]
MWHKDRNHAKNINKNTLINKILVGLLSWLILTAAQAARPLWIITAVPGSKTTLTVPKNGTATVQYLVQNESAQSKNLVAQPMPGIIQTTPCQLAPKGQSGSSCTLNLFIIGSALPLGGIHSGPVLCEAPLGGSPNPNQCYQPSAAILNITRGDVGTTISITSPVQQNRVVAVFGASLSLEVTNDASSTVNADAITVSNKAACPNLSIDGSNCASVAPGANCTLKLTSDTPYAPCTITVSGSNTLNSPQTLIAFSHLGGLVFQESGGSGKVVIDEALEFKSQWTSNNSDIFGATSLDDGVANTDAIFIDGACANDPSQCAARLCRDTIGVDWYLPARNELSAIHSALCSNLVDPCNFGGFSNGVYWSSSQLDLANAWFVFFPLGIEGGQAKNIEVSARCIRTFPP